MDSSPNETTGGCCPLCDSPDAKFVAINPDFDPAGIFKCRKCGMMFTSPIPAEEELAKRYREEYRNTRNETASQSYIDFMDCRARAQFDFISRDAGKDWRGKKVFETGCGAGSLLHVFSEAGASVAGCEPDAAMAIVARERLPPGSQIDESIFRPDVHAVTKNDLVCMSHVLEHVRDPLNFLREVRTATASGGYLFVEIPCETEATVSEVCREKLTGQMHLLFFQTATLKACLEKAGWSVTSVTQFGPSRKSWSMVHPRKRSWNLAIKWRFLRALDMIGVTLPAYTAMISPPFKDLLNVTKSDGIWIRALAQNVI